MDGLFYFRGRQGLLETVSHFVIPAKSADTGREPGSRKDATILDFYWIPDLAPRSGARPE